MHAFEESETPRLRLGSVAPDFEAETTSGRIKFHEFIGESWGVLFSHPEDFTPVCTTEVNNHLTQPTDPQLGAFAKLQSEFEKRGVKLIGLSADTLASHRQWIQDINEVANTDLTFPIIVDSDRKISYLYDMIDHQDITNVDSNGMALTIRSVYFIDPKKTIRAIISYPASTGRNSKEVLRVIDSLQLGDKYKVVTPIDWEVINSQSCLLTE